MDCVPNEILFHIIKYLDFKLALMFVSRFYCNFYLCKLPQLLMTELSNITKLKLNQYNLIQLWNLHQVLKPKSIVIPKNHNVVIANRNFISYINNEIYSYKCEIYDTEYKGRTSLIVRYDTRYYLFPQMLFDKLDILQIEEIIPILPKIQELPNDIIQVIGNLKIILLTRNGNLYFSGEINADITFYQHSLSDIIDISGNEDMLYCLTKFDTIYRIDRQRGIELINKNGNIVMISGNNRHLLMLTNQGSVYKSSPVYDSKFLHVEDRIELVTGIKNIIQISAGYDFYAILTIDGYVYTILYQSFHNFSLDLKYNPYQIPQISNITKIIAAFTDLFVINYHDAIYRINKETGNILQKL